MTDLQTFHIEIDEESDFSYRFHFDNKSTGLPLMLDGYRAEMQVRTDFNGAKNPEVVLTYTSEEFGGMVIGATPGCIDLYIPYEDTTNLGWTRGVYDIFTIAPQGRRQKAVKGFFTIKPSTTRMANTGLTDISAGQTAPYPDFNNFNVGGTSKDNA